MTPSSSGDRQLIGGYGPGQFRVAGQVFKTSILVFADRTLEWPVQSADGLTLESFDAVLAHRPPVEVLLLGTGAGSSRLIPEALRGGLRDAGIVLDTMDTGAACRTYNVLMAEDRRVAAALIRLD